MSRITIVHLEHAARFIDAYRIPLPGDSTLRPIRRAQLAGAVYRAGRAHDATLDAIFGRRRFANLVAARTDIAVAIRKRGWSYPEIGRALDRDHSTIMHHVQKREREDTTR